MSDDASTAVAVPPSVKTPPTPGQRRKRRPAGARPKPQPPYAVVLFNDDEHSFEYVVGTLMKVFGYPPGRAAFCGPLLLCFEASG